MAFQPFYKITDWQNLPSQKTALNRTNLLHAENGIKEADNRIVDLDARKAEMATVNAMVKDVSLDTTNGILTVTLLNGTIKSFDLDIEKVVTNFDITDDNKLVLTLADGTQKTIDLTRFVYSVVSSDTIALTITDRVLKAVLVDGSVTIDKLDTAIQTEFRQYMLDAQAARDAALQYQSFAKRYAIGDTVAFPGSEIDNSKYYYEQTKEEAELTAQNAQSASVSAATATEQATIATQKATSATASANSASADAQTTTEKAAAAAESQTQARLSATSAKDSEIAAGQQAQESADNALLSKRYAVGGVIPEDAEDNAKWYYQQTQNLKNIVDAASKLVVPQFYIDFETGELMSDKAATGINFYIEDGVFYGEMEVAS